MNREDIEKVTNIVYTKEIPSGTQYKLENGCIINIYDNGTVNYQGKNIEETKVLLGTSKLANNKKVFVVYGHDEKAKTQLEAMLRRWSLEPIILDQVRTDGKTIIEKLEDCINDANYGIVLATPDDKGFKANTDHNEAKYRVRQNVVFELGMLLAKLGRKKVAILLKSIDNFEKPTDIDGLIYIPFDDSVESTGKSLAKEMSYYGYNIALKNL